MVKVECAALTNSQGNHDDPEHYRIEQACLRQLASDALLTPSRRDTSPMDKLSGDLSILSNVAFRLGE